MFKFKKSISSLPMALLFFTITFFTPYSQAALDTELSDGKKLNLIGIGIHQELRHDIYIGALFGPVSVTDAEALLDVKLAKRMSIRFISKYANRKLSRHWKERLALNNPRDKWQPLTREIIQFSDIFKTSFEIGDELNIDYLPGIGTQIYLNGTYFQTIKTPEFYSLLLNVWLGTNPPTKAFKNSIRGQDEVSIRDKMIEQFSGLIAIAGRFDQDLTPTKIQVSAISKDSSESSQKNSEKDKPTSIAKNKPKEPEIKTNTAVVGKKDEKETAPKIATKVKEQLPDEPSTAKNTNKESNNSSVSNSNDKKELLNEVKPTELTSSLIGTHIIEIPTTDSIVKEIAVDSSIKNNQPSPIIEDLFDADLAAGSYTRDLINSVRKYEEYPRQALINGEQGTVVVLVTIDSSGEVLNTDLIEKSGSRTLDRAVIRMVNKAAPFQVIPKELKLQTFEFELPITFQL